MGAEIDELEKLYHEAAEDNVFFVEYSGMPTAAGDLRDLKFLAKEDDMDPADFLEELVHSFLGAIVDLCVLGEKSDSRVEQCRSAWERLKERRDGGEWPRTKAVREELGLDITSSKRLGTF